MNFAPSVFFGRTGGRKQRDAPDAKTDVISTDLPAEPVHEAKSELEIEPEPEPKSKPTAKPEAQPKAKPEPVRCPQLAS